MEIFPHVCKRNAMWYFHAFSIYRGKGGGRGPHLFNNFYRAAAAAVPPVPWKSSPLTLGLLCPTIFFVLNFFPTLTSICPEKKKKKKKKKKMKHGWLNKRSLILNDGSDNFHAEENQTLEIQSALFGWNQFDLIDSAFIQSIYLISASPRLSKLNAMIYW